MAPPARSKVYWVFRVLPLIWGRRRADARHVDTVARSGFGKGDVMACIGARSGGVDRPARPSPLAVTVAILLSVALAACTSNSSTNSTGGGPVGTPAPLDAKTNPNQPKDDGPPKSGGTLRFAVDAETDGFNPVSNNFAQAGNLIASSIFDPLMKITADRKIEPYLAESVTPNADATVWTVKARPNVVFHDGTPFDGEAIRVNLATRKTSGLASIALEPIESVTKVDDMTAQVKMRQPWAAWNWTLASQTGYMISPANLLKEDGTVNPEASDRPIGTGPFRFAERQHDSFVKVTKNPTYWQAGKPYLDAIDFRIIVDPTARAKSLESGTIDAMITERPADVKKFRETPGYVQAEDFQGDTSAVMLNEAKPPFDNLNARKALAYATDRQSVIESVGDGLPPDATEPYNPAQKWYVADAPYPSFDLAKAKELVEAYKKETGQAALTFEIIGRPGDDQDTLLQVLLEQWKSAGIEATIKTLEQTQFLINVVYGKYQAAPFRNFSYVDPDSNYIFFHSSSAKGLDVLSINFTQMKEPVIDAALDEARASSDPEVRTKAYATVIRKLNENLGYIWLYHNLWAFTASDKVGGLKTVQDEGFARQDAKPWWSTLWMK
jgi:ABC-type transport system substrate-binding protein